jgi:hypothetical protein
MADARIEVRLRIRGVERTLEQIRQAMITAGMTAEEATAAIDEARRTVTEADAERLNLLASDPHGPGWERGGDAFHWSP